MKKLFIFLVLISSLLIISCMQYEFTIDQDILVDILDFREGIKTGKDGIIISYKLGNLLVFETLYVDPSVASYIKNKEIPKCKMKVYISYAKRYLKPGSNLPARYYYNESEISYIYSNIKLDDLFRNSESIDGFEWKVKPSYIVEEKDIRIEEIIKKLKE